MCKITFSWSNYCKQNQAANFMKINSYGKYVQTLNEACVIYNDSIKGEMHSSHS